MQPTPQNTDPQVDGSTCTTAFQNSCTKVEECVKNDPRSAILLSLGAGLGIGVVLGIVLGGSTETPSERGWFDRRTAERLGQRMMANVGNWVPDSISERFTS